MSVWNRLRRSDHEKVRQLLSPYLDGEVSQQEKATVEQHLRACRACQDELEGLRWTIGLLAQTSAEPLPRSFVLRKTDVEPARKAPRLQWAYPLLRGATAVAALLLIVTLAVDWGAGRGARPAGAPVQTRSIQNLQEEKALPQESAPQAAPLATGVANAEAQETPPSAADAQASSPPPLKTAPTAAATPTRANQGRPVPTGVAGRQAVPPGSPPSPTPSGSNRHVWGLIEAVLGALLLLLLGATWWTARHR
ncbi:MAG: hypothetical protein GXP41_00605 [Chloroflexi bacterium]|nr:hypothetical protein [Chloroflexota bacterium]